jgi:hypothetical protein
VIRGSSSASSTTNPNGMDLSQMDKDDPVIQGIILVFFIHNFLFLLF